MKLNVCVMDGVNIYKEDMDKLGELINDSFASKTLVCSDIVNINNRAIVLEKKIYSVDDDSFNIVLGGYIEKDNFIK